MFGTQPSHTSPLPARPGATSLDLFPPRPPQSLPALPVGALPAPVPDAASTPPIARVPHYQQPDLHPALHAFRFAVVAAVPVLVLVLAALLGMSLLDTADTTVPAGITSGRRNACPTPYTDHAAVHGTANATTGTLAVAPGGPVAVTVATTFLCPVAAAMAAPPATHQRSVRQDSFAGGRPRRIHPCAVRIVAKLCMAQLDGSTAVGAASTTTRTVPQSALRQDFPTCLLESPTELTCSWGFPDADAARALITAPVAGTPDPSWETVLPCGVVSSSVSGASSTRVTMAVPAYRGATDAAAAASSEWAKQFGSTAASALPSAVTLNVTHYGIVAQAVFTDAAPLFVERSAADALSVKTVYGTAAAPALPAGMVAVAPSSLTAAVPVSNSVRSPWFLVAVAIVVVGAVAVALVCAGVTPPRPSVASCALLLRCCDDDSLAHALSSGDYDSSSPPGSTRTHPRLTLKNIPFATDAVSGAVPTPAPAGRARDQLPREGDPEDQAWLFAQPIGRGTALTVGGNAVLTNTAPVQPQGESQLESEHEDGMWATNAEPGSHQNTELQVTDAGQISDAIGPPGRRASTPPSAGHQRSPHGGSPGLPSLPHEHGDGASTQGSTVSSESLSAASEEAIDLLVTDEISRRFAAPAFDGGMDGMDGRGADGRYRVREETSTILAVRLGPQSERYSQLSQMILDFAANADKSEGMRLASLCFIAPGIERGLLFDGPSAAADACSVAARIAEVIHAKSQVERHRDTHLTAGFSSPSVVVVTCHARVFITTGPEGRQTVCGTAAERIMALSHLNNVIRTMAICDEATMRQARVAAVAGGDQDAAIARRMRQVLGEEAGAFCHPSFTLVPCDRVAFPTDMKQFSVVTQSTSVPAGASTSVQRAGAGFGAGMSYSGSAVSKSGSLKEQMVFDIHPARFDGTADDALALKEFNAVLNHAGQPRCEWSDVAARLTSSIQRLAVRAAASLNAQAAAAAAREETASALEPGESSASLEEPGLGHGAFPMGDRPPPVTTEALLAMTLLDVWRQATSLPMLTSSPCLLVGTESGRRFFTRTDSGQSTASDYVYATVRSKRRRRGAGDGGTGQGGVKLLDAMAPSSLPSTASGVKPTLPAPLWFVLVHAKRLLLQADMRRVAGVTKGAGYSMRRPGWEAFPTEMTGSGELASDHSSSRAGRLSASPGAALAPMMGPTFGTFGSRRGPPLITPAALPDIPGQESESDSGPPPGQASAATRPAGESAGTPGERPSPKSRARSYLRATETTEGTNTDPYGDLPPALPLEFPQVLSPTDAPPEGFHSVPAVASITSADAPPPPQVIAAANDEGRFFGDTEELCHTPFDNPLWDAYYLRRDVAAALRRVAQQKQRLAEKRLEKQTKLEEQNTGGGFGLLTFMSPDDEELNEDVFINEALPPPSQGVGSDRQSLDYFIDRRNWKWSLSTQFIGSGAFGNVYSGIGQNGVIVAIKQHDLWTNQPHVCDQCIRETRALARASAETQHIAQYVSAAVVGRWLCVVQQALGGGTLAELTSSAYPKLPMSVIVRCLRDILRGLEHLEDRFMVHRDVKPANIMRDSYGNCKLIDFGTARWLGGISGHRARAQHSSFDVGDTTDDGGRQRRTFGDSVNEVLTPRPDGGGYESMIPQTLRKLVHRHHRSSDIGVSGIDEVARELAARHLQQTANPPPAQQTAWGGGGGGPNLPGGLPPLPANVAQDAATAIAQTAREVRPPTNEAIPMQPAMSSPDEGSTSQRPGGSLVAPPKPEVGQWTTEQAGLLEKAVKTALSQPRAAAAAAAGPALVPALTTGGGLPPRAPGALSTASVVTDGPGAASARTALPTPHSNAAPDSAPPPVVFGSTLPDAPRSALASTGPTSSQGSGTFRGIPTVPPATVEGDSPQGGPAVLPAPLPLPPLSGLSSLAAMPAPLPGQDLLGPGHLPSGHASTLASIAYNPSSYGGGLPGVPSVPAPLPEADDLRGTVPVPNLGGPPVAPLIGLTPAPLLGDGMAAPGTPALGHLRPGGPGFSPNTSTSSQHVPSVPGVVVGVAADRPRDSSNTGDAPVPRTPSVPSAGGLSGSLLGPTTEQLPVVVPAAAPPPVFAPPISGMALPVMVGGGVVVPPPALASIITPQVPGGGSVAGSGGNGSVLGGNLFPAPMGPPPATASAGTTSGERQRSLPLPSVSGAVGGSVVGGGMSGALSPGAEEAGGVCGTPQFMAPEIANGEIHPRSDIWSFGVVALMLVTQQGPYPEFASTPQEALVKTLATCRRRPITTIVQHPKLRHLVERCLSIDPRERPSAKQLLQEEIFSEAIDAPAQDTSRSN